MDIGPIRRIVKVEPELVPGQLDPAPVEPKKREREPEPEPVPA